MIRMPRISVAAFLAISILSTMGQPVAALNFKGDGLYSSFHWGVNQTGIVVVLDKLGTDNQRATIAAVVGRPMEQLTLNLRSISCSGSPARSNRVARLEATTNSRGTYFGTQSLLPYIEADTIKSIWLDLGSGNDAVTVCSLSINFSKIEFVTGDWDGDGALSAQTGDGQLLGNLLLLERLPTGRERLTFLYDHAQAGDDYDLRLVTGRCGRSVGTVQWTVSMTDVLVSGVTRRTTNLTQNELDSLRSVRLRNLTHTAWRACEPLGIIAILVD
jgi:hypothetical protein